MAGLRRLHFEGENLHVVMNVCEPQSSNRAFQSLFRVLFALDVILVS